MTTIDNELVSILAEGMHTGYRKAVDTPQADRIWHLIHEMKDEDWGRYVEYVAKNLLTSAAWRYKAFFDLLLQEMVEFPLIMGDHTYGDYCYHCNSDKNVGAGIVHDEDCAGLKLQQMLRDLELVP